MTPTPNAVVTGGASGMGLEMARLIIERGGRVLIADMDERALGKAREALGQSAIIRKTDISIETEVEDIADAAFDTLGRVDLVFANAGLQFDAEMIEATTKEFDLQFGTNIKGSWMTAKAFARRWIDRNETGRICFTGSEHSLGFQHAEAGLYTATKHAILGLADVMRHELPNNIGVSVFCPGLVDTNFYASREKAGLGADEDELEQGAALMSHGMDPRKAARGAIEGAIAGEWLIMTHSVAREGAKTRWEEIDDAFQRQAPPGSDAKNYKVRDLKQQMKEDA